MVIWVGWGLRREVPSASPGHSYGQQSCTRVPGAVASTQPLGCACVCLCWEVVNCKWWWWWWVLQTVVTLTTSLCPPLAAREHAFSVHLQRCSWSHLSIGRSPRPAAPPVQYFPMAHPFLDKICQHFPVSFRCSGSNCVLVSSSQGGRGNGAFPNHPRTGTVLVIATGTGVLGFGGGHGGYHFPLQPSSSMTTMSSGLPGAEGT